MSLLPFIPLSPWVAGWLMWLDSSVNQAKALGSVSVMVISAVSVSYRGT